MNHSVETPPGSSPNSPLLLFEYQCRSGKFIRLANRIEKIDSVARIESNRNFLARIGMLYTPLARVIDEPGRPTPNMSTCLAAVEVLAVIDAVVI